MWAGEGRTEEWVMRLEKGILGEMWAGRRCLTASLPAAFGDKDGSAVPLHGLARPLSPTLLGGVWWAGWGGRCLGGGLCISCSPHRALRRRLFVSSTSQPGRTTGYRPSPRVCSPSTARSGATTTRRPDPPLFTAGAWAGSERGWVWVCGWAGCVGG